MTNSKDSEIDPIQQSLKIQNHTFPGIWRFMMPKEFLQMDFPDERRATCMDCPKACFDDYRPDYRCCTYFPRIPNFLLGLATKTEAGADMVRQIIAEGYITPEGMNSTPKQWIDYLQDLEDENFGKSTEVLCPMLDRSNGYCRVHAFRNSVCSTFFCHKDHGNKGEDFWTKVQTLGSQLEMAIAQWSMEQVGIDVSEYIEQVDSLAKSIKQVADPKSKGWSIAARKKIWGKWYGKEFEFFQKCGELVSVYREQLWDIGNQSDIYEAKKFDKAMVRSVPKSLKHQLDPSDLEESGETVSPEELWKGCIKSYRKLWKLPAKEYRLSKKVELVENTGDDEQEKKFSDSPYLIRFMSKGEIEDQIFIDTKSHDLLQIFQSGQHVGWELLTELFSDRYGDGKKFLSEMIALKVLVPVK